MGSEEEVHTESLGLVHGSSSSDPIANAAVLVPSPNELHPGVGHFMLKL